jgi:tetratricopeptide (TPR) repeat protein
MKALDGGAFEQAVALLREIRVQERAASIQRRRDVEKAGIAWITGLQSEADTCALLGRAALSRADVEEAVAQFREGLELLAPADSAPRWSYLMDTALALYKFGDLAGRNDALAAGIDLYRRALADAPRERAPFQWAMTQNNLGASLQTLGHRECSTARLEEAIAAYRATLEEQTRERYPVTWAMTQNNLGNALRILGEREGGTARLEKAVAAYRSALLEYTRHRVPLLWAATQSNFGIALRALGERQWDGARLEEAIAAYRDALKERTRERVPLQWATTQNNLGNALLALGEREWDGARLEEAIAAYRDALTVFVETDAEHYIRGCKANMAQAETLLKERQQRP